MYPVSVYHTPDTSTHPESWVLSTLNTTTFNHAVTSRLSTTVFRLWSISRSVDSLPIINFQGLLSSHDSRISASIHFSMCRVHITSKARGQFCQKTICTRLRETSLSVGGESRVRVHFSICRVTFTPRFKIQGQDSRPIVWNLYTRRWCCVLIVARTSTTQYG